MGCDIHLHIEVKIDGAWEHYAQLGPHRDYPAFAKMANVRNCDPGSEHHTIPISKPKGLPQELSKLTELDLNEWAGDAHSHSWLNRDELATLVVWWRQRSDVSHSTRDEHLESWVGTYLYGNGFDYPTKFLEDVRFVFWFDN